MNKAIAVTNIANKKTVEIAQPLFTPWFTKILTGKSKRNANRADATKILLRG